MRLLHWLQLRVAGAQDISEGGGVKVLLGVEQPSCDCTFHPRRQPLPLLCHAGEACSTQAAAASAALLLLLPCNLLLHEPCCRLQGWRK
jgi:hypothetical protein